MSTSRASFTRRSSSAMTARRPSARSIWTTAACITISSAAHTSTRCRRLRKSSATSSKRSPGASARTQSFSKTTRLCESSSAPACASSPRCCKTKKKKSKPSGFDFFLFSITFRAARARRTRHRIPSALPHRAAVRFQASNPDRAALPSSESWREQASRVLSSAPHP